MVLRYVQRIISFSSRHTHKHIDIDIDIYTRRRGVVLLLYIYKYRGGVYLYPGGLIITDSLWQRPRCALLPRRCRYQKKICTHYSRGDGRKLLYEGNIWPLRRRRRTARCWPICIYTRIVYTHSAHPLSVSPSLTHSVPLFLGLRELLEHTRAQHVYCEILRVVCISSSSWNLNNIIRVLRNICWFLSATAFVLFFIEFCCCCCCCRPTKIWQYYNVQCLPDLIRAHVS